MAPKKRSFEDAVKTNMVLRKTHVVFLDRLMVSIRESTGAIVDRSSIVRAMTEAVQASGVDLTGVHSEEELASILTELLAGASQTTIRKSRKSKEKEE